MSYQVLARKWRPRNFREMVGQEHVLKALVNALDHNRLHHAYLFTGTRGVGKTTIARILAKCLNCEAGITSTPCGECSACAEIGAGRFVDLIEVDAASRTRVEDTRELLDNVQYAPTRGRFKIYLIDEVHMLSTHSFNALLKTLEEPPEHVKFLLATTDPQKLPVTILSRCLQFNLKNMSPERIVAHLKTVLEKEQLPYEESALWLLARSADGSMRDALSLADQAIGFGSGKVGTTDVSAMLGTIDHRLIETLLDALADSDGRAVLATIDAFAEQAPDYGAALADLLTALHRIAIAQAVPEALDNSFGDRERIVGLASRIPAEDVQLFYQIALTGRRDLDLAPDLRAGFEMILLRMLAFRPQYPGGLSGDGHSGDDWAGEGNSGNDYPDKDVSPRSTDKGASASDRAVAASRMPMDASGSITVQASGQEADPTGKKPVTDPGARPGTAPPQAIGPAAGKMPDNSVPAAGPSPRVENMDVPWAGEPSVSARADMDLQATVRSSPQPPLPRERERALTADERVPTSAWEDMKPAEWLALYQSLSIRGILQTTFGNCVLLNQEQGRLVFVLDQAKASLYDDSHGAKLAELLSGHFKAQVKVDIRVQALPEGAVTPVMAAEQRRIRRRQEVLEQLQCDPVVLSLQHELGGRLVPESVQVKQ